MKENEYRNQNRKIHGKSPSIWKLNESLNNPCVKEETKREIIKYFELTKKENKTCLAMGYS